MSSKIFIVGYGIIILLFTYSCSSTISKKERHDRERYFKTSIKYISDRGNDNKNYSWKKKSKDSESTLSTDSLKQKYPNPFAPSTRFNFYLNDNDSINITLLNKDSVKLGTIYKGLLEKGLYEIILTDINIDSGIYLLLMQYRTEEYYRKIIMVK